MLKNYWCFDLEVKIAGIDLEVPPGSTWLKQQNRLIENLHYQNNYMIIVGGVNSTAAPLSWKCDPISSDSFRQQETVKTVFTT